MRSVGLDTTAGSGGTSAGAPLYRAIPDLEATKGFDLMSYCNITFRDPAHWILRAHLEPAARRRRRRGDDLPATGADERRRPALTVRGRVDGNTPSIVSVHPVDNPGASSGGPSPYTLVARDAAGGVLASTAMTQNLAHPAAGAPDYVQFQGSVPRGRVARVQVMQGTTVVTERAASSHPPIVAVSTPRNGARIRTQRSLTVRWKAADADPGDALVATVEVSSDGGASYRAVAGGANEGSATLAAGTFTASPRARLRVRIDDGFSVALSKPVRLVAEPSAPKVTITEPVRLQRIAAGASIYLRGGATDDHGRRIRGSRLRWIADGLQLGRGESLSAVLPAGTRSVRLTAIDAAGRRGAASVTLRPQATTPFFLRLDARSRLPRTTRSITLRVASTQPARLRIGARHFSVSPHATRIRLRVRPGRSTIRLRLVLSAGGRRTEQALVITRS